VKDEQIQFKNILVTAGKGVCGGNIIRVQQPDVRDIGAEEGYGVTG